MSGLEAIAILGFALQVVDTTVRVIDLWKATNEVGQEVIIIKARLDMIRARLKTWALGWGRLNEEDLKKSRRFKDFGSLALRYVLIIQYRLTALEDFDKKYPSLFRNDRVLEGQPRSADRGLQLALIAQTDGPDAKDLELLHKEVASINHANIIQRWRWARKGGEGMKMTDQIAALVGELEDFFIPPTSDQIEPVDLDRNQPPVEGSGEDRAFKVVQGIATFKKAAEEMRNRTDSMHQRELLRSHRGIKNEKKQDNTKQYSTHRSLANFKARDINITPVMIEWIYVPSSLSAEIKEASQNQIHDLALLLHSEKKPHEFRTLECIAMVDMPVAEEEDAQYGLVFKLEEGHQVYTLLELLSREESTPKSLTERLKLVKLLSKTLLFLHLGSWLHKGIRSDNILFLSNDISSVDLGAAYIGGFDYSRLFRETRLTQNVGDNRVQNLYRHPDHQGHPMHANGESTDRPPFSYKADLYSLGVVLVEIGLWSPIIKLLEARGSQDEDESVRETILDMIPQVRMRMGDAFADAAEACLRSEFGTGEAGQPESVREAFYLSVVRLLERCFI
ncbi:kinase catalytic domain protein [Fusarium subglutinans]|uniref:Kinase catalytic domain protein n=1 Tax=Gibberella subglutinans TaxID=42677 RepID=A0A8H5LFJ4_GIBSU|nr:kinase catalytic domain protein [Fusarium subglutinans]KAF5589816.1 kinase catalytic domain protein [Fusarium subglutinans]